VSVVTSSHPAAPVRRRHIVVIGASAGGVETLQRVVRGLPADLEASVCVVLHISPGSPSALAAILGRAAMLPCRTAVDGERLRDGEILVAPPDRHLIVADGRVSVTAGPRENGHRPSVDVLFRSAAADRDAQVIGVVLTGTQDDGTAGLAVIKANGGAAIVQDPDEALYAPMPANAIAHVEVDAVVPSDEVADAIVGIVTGDVEHPDPPAAGPGPPPLPGPGVTATCPECGGLLVEHREAGVTQWRCSVGHRYSPESLADAQAEAVQAAMWAAVRVLEDRQALLSRMGAQLESRGHPRSADSFHHRAREARDQADSIRAALDDATARTLKRLAGVAGAEPTGDRVLR
jgi:two-component system, chemotaxis family, protein-glutamate methylesterase/glutaminase